MQGWYVVHEGRDIAGPFSFRESALMALASYPFAHVEKHDIGRRMGGE